MKQHLQGSDSRFDSSSECLGIRHNAKPPTRKHEDDDDMEAMLRRRKQLKKTTTLLASSSAASKLMWTKTAELLILRCIVDYQKETKSSYTSDWNAVYGRIRDSLESDFSKEQLTNKVAKLKMRFLNNQARSNDGKRLSFADADDEQVFKLSTVIWGKIKAKASSNENMDRTKEEARKIDDGHEKDKCEEDGVDNLSVLQEALGGAEHHFRV